MSEQKLKPFIKWVGGKSQLLHEIEQRLPSFIVKNEKFNYVEPFVGSGAVLFFLLNKYEENMNRIIINDLNKRLIYLYETIIYNPYQFIDRINDIDIKYKSKLTELQKKEYYLEKRKELNSLEIVEKNKLNISAYFLFLNKTGYNGMYRENKNGDYNIPFGKQKNPSFLNERNILNISKTLEKKLEIRNESYENILIEDSSFNTFYYLDPPYIPINKTSNFTEYINNIDFSSEESLNGLLDYVNNIRIKNGCIMLSNSFHKDSYDNFKEIGGNIDIIKARRSINSKADKRGLVNEIILTIN